MKTLLYAKGDLFSAPPPNCILVHACNAKGVWGSGIAATFATKYPDAYKVYNHWCGVKVGSIVGKCLYITDKGTRQKIGCLITSEDYGARKDTQARILDATYEACMDLFRQINENELILSPKINAGRFGVPWQYTEEVIKKAIDKAPKHTLVWEVWSL